MKNSTNSPETTETPTAEDADNTSLDKTTGPDAFDTFLASIEAALRRKFEGSGEEPEVLALLNAQANSARDGSTVHAQALSPREQLLAYALAKGASSYVELSRLTGLAPSTVSRYTNDPRIKRAVSLIQHAAGLTDVITKIRHLTPRAVEVLAEIMNDTAVPASARLDAAKTILERIYGKAVQPVEASGNLIATFLAKIDSRDELQSLASDLFPGPATGDGS